MAGNRFNVRNIHYAKNTKGPEGVVTRSTPQKIAGAMKVTVNPTVQTGNLYGDGTKSDEITKMTGANIALEMNRIPTDIVNEMFGKNKDPETGISEDSIEDEPIEFSIGWEVELTGNHAEFVWFTKCKAQPIQSEVQQGTDNVNFSTDTLNIVAMPDEDGKIRLFGETIDETFKCKETWFKSVPPVAPIAKA